MLAGDIKVSQTSETRKYEAGGKATPYLRVEFMVANHGPFVETFLKDGFTAQQRDDRLNAFANEVRTL